MNTDYDSLEAELRSLRPRDPSPQLQQQIAAELSASAAVRLGSGSRPGHFLLAAAALAVCLLIAAVVIRPGTRRTTEVPTPLAESPAAAAFDAALPSVWQLHNAINRSDSDLDALLDQHAARPPAPAISFVQIRGFGRSDPNLETLLGEL
jgi:hypothetical protein